MPDTRPDEIRIDEDGCCVVCGRTGEPCAACDRRSMEHEQVNEAARAIADLMVQRDDLLLIWGAAVNAFDDCVALDECEAEFERLDDELDDAIADYRRCLGAAV